MPTFSADYLRNISQRLLVAAGVPSRDAEIVSNSLVESNLCGHDSHGVHILVYYLDRIRKGVIKPGSAINVERESEVSALVNGNWNFGQLVAASVMEIAERKAKRAGGISFVGAFNCNHVGRLGGYCEPIAERGLIAVMMVNSPPSVAPWGGIDRRLGTNPICFALPRRSHSPIVLDMSTAVVANGKVSLLLGTGKRIPEGWAIDKNGKPTTKPEEFENGGAMLPVGGYKGFGLGLVVDLLCGALTSSGGCDRIPRDGANGVAAVVIRPDIFFESAQEDGGEEKFLASVESTLKFVLGSRLQKGFKEILLPGEPEQRAKQERERAGVFVNDAVWKKIEASSRELGVAL